MPDIVRGTPQQYIPVKQTEVIKPNAYLNSTPPVHKKGFVNGTGKNTLSGSSIGFSFGGPYGAAIGGLIGLGTDIWQAVFAKRAAKRANEESKQAAARASAQNANESRAARNYNSEQAQIRRLRMAGLSPGLAYGNMSPSTAQPASAEKQDVSKADTPKFDNESILRALELLVKEKQAETAAAAQESTAGLQSSQTQLNLIDLLTRNESNLANIRSVLSSSSLSDANKLEVLTLLFGKQENLAANTRKTLADAGVTEQTGVNLANSQIASNNASAAVNNHEANILKLTYDLDNAQWQAVQNFMKSNGFDESLAPLVMKALSSIANRSGNTLESVLSSLASIPGSLIEHYLNKFMPEYEDFVISDEVQSGKNAHSKHTETTKGRRRK